jgi:cell division protein FtsL
VALPLRVLDAPFTRALRARTSGVLDALLAGRGWIALVGVLLVGIVFFNVDLLRMNREIALTAERAEVVKRENARLRQEAALLGSSQRIQDAAAGLGLVMPVAGDVRYLKAHPGADARRAARLIVEPNDLAAAPAPTAVTTPEPVTPVATPDATAAPGQTGVATPTAGTGTDTPATATTPEAALGGTATAPGATAQQVAPTSAPPAG